MTIKEFSVKYGLKYKMAFDASYDVSPHITRDNKKEYDEKEMLDSLINMLTAKRQRHIDAVDKIDSIRYRLIQKSQEFM